MTVCDAAVQLSQRRWLACLEVGEDPVGSV
jgi:hypothetical protein